MVAGPGFAPGTIAYEAIEILFLHTPQNVQVFIILIQFTCNSLKSVECDSTLVGEQGTAPCSNGSKPSVILLYYSPLLKGYEQDKVDIKSHSLI